MADEGWVNPHPPVEMSSTYCEDTKHVWRDLRSRSARDDGSWFMFKGCKRCTATLETIVSHTKNSVGEIIPTVKVWLLTGYGCSDKDAKAKTITKEVVGVHPVEQLCEAKLIKG